MNREECLANALLHRRKSNRGFWVIAAIATVSTLFGDLGTSSIYVFALACSHGLASFWEERVRRYS